MSEQPDLQRIRMRLAARFGARRGNLPGQVAARRHWRKVAATRAVTWASLSLPLLMLLAGCAPGDTPIDRMDAYFDSVSGRPPASTIVVQQAADPITARPGYAPAYPPYQMPARAATP